MKNAVICIVLLAILLAMPFQVSGADYYVSPAGSAAWNQCTSINAPCSLATANQNAVAGDTVYLRGGTYTAYTFIAPLNSGESGNPITFAAYNGEIVIANSQIVPNYDHEQNAWSALDGSEVFHSAAQAYEGSYSTGFRATDGGHGIRSDAFTISSGSYFTLWVYSDQPNVNVYIQKGDGSGPAVNQDFAILPNQWNKIGRYFPASGDPGYGQNIRGDNAFIAVRSPNSTAGTWYVDDVRMHAHGYAAIHLDGDDYIKVQGTIVNNSQRGLVIEDGSSYNEVSNCAFTNIENGYYTPNAIMDGWNPPYEPSTHNWIHDNTFYENGYVVTTAVEDCDDIINQFRIGSGNAATDYSRYNLIENNTFYSGGHDNIIISTSNNIIRNNMFHNEGWIENKIGNCQDSDGNPRTYNNLSKFGNRNVLFENPSHDVAQNLIEGNRIGFAGTPPDDDGANGIEMPTDGNVIRYNDIFGNGLGGIYFKQQSGNPDNNRIYHNSIYRNGRGEDIDLGYQAGLKYNCYLTNPVGNVIKNNIVFDNAQGPVRGCTPDVIYNLNTYTNNFEQDPFFVNPDLRDPFSKALPDLALQGGSGAIDNGTYLTQANGSGNNSLTLRVDDAMYFQDGTWGSDLAMGVTLFPDWISIETVDNAAQISSINYTTNTITLASTQTWSDRAYIWLSRKSDGARVLYGSAPDIGAHEYGGYFHRADLNSDGCVDIPELLAFIERWKISNADVSLREIIEAIGLWKRGCP